MLRCWTNENELVGSDQMDSESCSKEQDVSDILVNDLGKRLIEKDHYDNQQKEDASARKKVRSSKEDQQQATKKSSIDYSLVDLKYINKTPDEIIENTLKELTSLNDLLNHALDKTLGLSEQTAPTQLNLVSTSAQDPKPTSTGDRNSEFTDFKVPKLPSSKKESSSSKSKKTSSSKSSKKTKSTSSNASSPTSSVITTNDKESINESDLFNSIVKEVIPDSEDGEIGDDDSKGKTKKKKKKESKHPHQCSKHRKRKESVERDRQSSRSPSKEQLFEDDHPFRDPKELVVKRGEEYFNNNKTDDYYSSSREPYKNGYYDQAAVSNRPYTGGDKKRPSFDRNQYEHRYEERYHQHDKFYDKSFDRDYAKPYNKTYDDKLLDRSYDKFHDKYYEDDDDRELGYKDPFRRKRLRAENTVSQWTKICSKISKEQQDDDNSSIESRDFYSDDDDTRSIISDRILNRDSLKAKKIRFEVRDFKSRQARSANEIKQELMEQFPVSSGHSHWKEVIEKATAPEKKSDEKKSKKTNAKEQELEDKVDDFLNKHVQINSNKSGFDIGTIMSQRLSALKILTHDANNITALKQLKEADDLINEWSKSANQDKEDELNKVEMTVSSVRPGCNLITVDNQTYETYSDFTKAARSKDGIGMELLCKMGWQPGQGLGRNNEGAIEPLIPELKLDTKGLITEEEKPYSRRNNVQSMYNIPQPTPIPINNKNKSRQNNLQQPAPQQNPIQNKTVSNNNASAQGNCEQLTAIANRSIMSGKHPVNVLQEVCSKRKWTQPTYTIVSEEGPAHKKNFLFKCTLINLDYLPSFSSPNKKLAKAIAAIVCLQAFGLVNFDEANQC